MVTTDGILLRSVAFIAFANGQRERFIAGYFRCILVAVYTCIAKPSL